MPSTILNNFSVFIEMDITVKRAEINSIVRIELIKCQTRPMIGKYVIYVSTNVINV